jgi:nitroreductase
MELYEAMRSTFAARHYLDEQIPDEVLFRMLDNARFAPSGGNRQGWRLLVIKNKDIRRQLKGILEPTIKQYKTQAMNGETPFCSIGVSSVTSEAIDKMSPSFPLVDEIEDAPVLLVICVDLSLVTSFDKDLDRVGVISGASIYPFAWNILLAARNEGLGGVLTTFLAHQEEAVKSLLDVPKNYAVAALLGIGKPVKQLTKLKRYPVASFTWLDTFDGEQFAKN